MKRKCMGGLIAIAAIAAVLCAPSARADYCELSWDVPCCLIPGTNMGMATVTLTICNCTDIPAEYTYLMKSSVPGTTFSPGAGSVFLMPGECIDIPITVFCVAGGPAGKNFLFANITNQATGAGMECPGLVREVFDFKVTPTGGGVIVTPFPGPGMPIPVNLTVNNIGSSGNDGVEISFLPMGPIEAPAPIFVPVLPGQSRLVTVTPLTTVATEGGVPGQPLTGALLIEWDDDGDGVPEVNSSVSFRFEGVVCPGDINGDGIVNGADLAGLLANWGLCN